MQKQLYFTCPTDCLETIINRTFQQENYYYSSLGNSIKFNRSVIRQLTKLIQEKNILTIEFILSNDNRIVLDGLGNQDYLYVRGLSKFYQQIIRQKKSSEISWQSMDTQSLILSYYLNKKINELKSKLKDTLEHQLRISAKIYNRQEEIFTEIYSDLICQEHAILN